MTKQELADYCSNRIGEIREKLNEKDEEYKYYDDFFQKYSINTVKSAVQIPTVDLMIAFLNSVLDKPFEEVKSDVDSFSLVFKLFGSEEIKQLRMTLSMFYESDKENFDALKKVFSDSNKRRSYDLVLHCEDGEDEEFVEYIVQNLISLKNNFVVDIAKLLDYYEEAPMIMINLMNFIVATKEYGKFYDKIQMETSNMIISETGSRSSRMHKKIFTAVMKGMVHYSEFYKFLEPISLRYNELVSNQKSKERKLMRSEKAYLEFIEKLPRIFNRDEINNYESIIKNIDDEDVRLEFLKLVYEHNMEEYDKTMLNYNELAKNSSIRFLTLLQENGISKDDVRISSIMKNNYDDVEKMLKILKMTFDEDKTVVIKALELANLVDVLYIKELIDKGVLSKEVVVNDISLFSSESNVRKLLDENIKLLNEFGLNPAILGVNSELLIYNESLKNSLSILKDYDLLKYLRGQDNYLFLEKNNLNTQIDKLLELGYESYLKEDITLLNEDNIDRIYVLKSVGIMPKNKEELLSCLRTNKFFVADDKINNYIHNVVDYVNDDFKLDIDTIISEYDNTNRTISINGVILSKNRIKRNRESGDFKSIISDSILSKDEIDILKSELKSKALIKNS